MQKTNSNVFKYLIAGALAFLLALSILLTAPTKQANAATEEALTTSYEWGSGGESPNGNANILSLSVSENLSGRTIYINPYEFYNWNPIANNYSCSSWELNYAEIITSNGKTLRIGPATGSDIQTNYTSTDTGYYYVMLPDNMGYALRIMVYFNFLEFQETCYGVCGNCDIACTEAINVTISNVTIDLSKLNTSLPVYVNINDDTGIADYETQINALESEKATLAADISSLEQQIADANTEIQNNNTEIAALQSEITSLNEQIAAGGSDNANIEELQARLDEATAEWNELINKNEKAVEARDALNEKLAEINDKYDVNIGKIKGLEDLYKLAQDVPTGEEVGSAIKDTADQVAGKINGWTGLEITGSMLIMALFFFVIKLLLRKR